LNSFALAHGILLSELDFSERASGALEIEQRPELLRLLNALLQRGVKGVLVSCVSRLSRDLRILLNLFKTFRDLKLDFICADDDQMYVFPM